MKEGLFPPTESALLELYRLLAIFLASKSFAELRTGTHGEGEDPIRDLQEVEVSEIFRILLMLAVTARVVDDREKRIFDLLGFKCGTLQRDLASETREDLTLREAFNKIMHARKLRSDIEYNGEGQEFFNPTIYLYGTQGSKEWRATLDVIAFAKEYYSLMRHY